MEFVLKTWVLRVSFYVFFMSVLNVNLDQCTKVAMDVESCVSGGQVLSARGYVARSRAGRHASGLQSRCGGA